MGAVSDRRVLLDCDAGTDDAQALMMALSRRDVIMVAVTCTFGNTTVDNVTKNVLRVLNVCGRLDVPVYRGSEVSLLGNKSPLNGYHGDDGLGDVPDACAPTAELITNEHAANALVRLVNLYPARGNVTMSAEFNFHADPEAAYSVLKDLGAPISLVPLELCWKHSFSWEWYARLMSTPTQKARFLRACEHNMVERNKSRGNRRHFMHDQLAMAAAVQPGVIQETRHVYATVELAGNQTRGQVVLDWSLDWSGVSHREKNVDVITQIDADLYECMLFDALNGVTTD